MFVFKTRTENETKRLVPDLFPFYNKALHEVAANGQHLSFIMYLVSILLVYY